MSPQQKLIAEIRTLEIVTHGKRVELCMALGDRTNAAWHLREMNTLIAARFAHMEQLEEEGGCYFLIAADMARMQAEARAASTFVEGRIAA